MTEPNVTGEPVRKTEAETALYAIVAVLGLFNLFEASSYFLTVWRSLTEQGLSLTYLGAYLIISGTPLLGFTLAISFAAMAVADRGWVAVIGAGIASYFLKSVPVLVWALIATAIWGALH